MNRVVVVFISLCIAAVSVFGQGRACRIVTYNVGVFSKYDDDSTREVADMMHELGADVMALCELDSCNRRHATFQLKEFAVAMEDVSEVSWCYGYGSAMEWNGGAYGLGVLSRMPLDCIFEINLPKGDGYEPRVCVVAETAAYVVAAVHLDHKSEIVRMEQARLLTDELVRLYGRSRRPVFLCGDLNATPESSTLRQLSEDWTVLSAQASTYPSHQPDKCIDYILALKNRARYKVERTAVCTEFESADVVKASDHLPVFVDVVIK